MRRAASTVRNPDLGSELDSAFVTGAGCPVDMVCSENPRKENTGDRISFASIRGRRRRGRDPRQSFAVKIPQSLGTAVGGTGTSSHLGARLYIRYNISGLCDACMPGSAAGVPR